MPYNTRDPMGTLRSMLHEPKKQTWPQILELLLYWPKGDELYAVALPYCHDILSQPERRGPLEHRPASSDIYALSLGRAPEEQDITRLMALLCLCTDNYPTQEMWKALQHPVTTPEQQPPRFDTCLLERITFTLRRSTQPLIDYLTQHAMPNLHTLALSTTFGLNDEVVDTTDLVTTITGASWVGPQLKTLNLNIKNDDMLSLAQSADLSGIETLDFSGAEGLHTPQALKVLLDQLTSDNLRMVNLAASHCWPEHLDVIANHPSMANLQTIKLQYNDHLTPADITRFRRSAIIPRPTLKAIDEHYEDIFE